MNDIGGLLENTIQDYSMLLFVHINSATTDPDGFAFNPGNYKRPVLREEKRLNLPVISR